MFASSFAINEIGWQRWVFIFHASTQCKSAERTRDGEVAHVKGRLHRRRLDAVLQHILALHAGGVAGHIASISPGASAPVDLGVRIDFDTDTRGNRVSAQPRSTTIGWQFHTASDDHLALLALCRCRLAQGMKCAGTWACVRVRVALGASRCGVTNDLRIDLVRAGLLAAAGLCQVGCHIGCGF